MVSDPLTLTVLILVADAVLHREITESYWYAIAAWPCRTRPRRAWVIRQSPRQYLQVSLGALACQASRARNPRLVLCARDVRPLSAAARNPGRGGQIYR